VWDEHGINVLADNGEMGQIGLEFRVYIQKRQDGVTPSILPGGELYVDPRPEKNYRGLLVVDGVEIGRGLTRDQFMLWKEGKKIKRRVFDSRWGYGVYSKGRDDVYANLYIYFYPRKGWRVRGVYISYDTAIPSLKYGARIDDEEIICVDDSEEVRRAKANKPTEAQILGRELKSLLREGLGLISD